MSEVKRHTVHGYGRQDIYYNEPDGEFVFYEDYAELKAQRDALAVECAALKQVFATKEFSSEVTDVFSDTAVLRIDGDEYHSWQWVDNDSAVIRAVLEVMKPETPAIDAYLNSVRADAVVNAAAHLGDMASGKSPSTAELIKSCGRSLLAFAAQLRAGEVK
ncbi:MAG: hypothetical protein [Caudoviricetes sp.]|nr:MAG: hypothetical protein [Caudoviricetes sp.]